MQPIKWWLLLGLSPALGAERTSDLVWLCQLISPRLSSPGSQRCLQIGGEGAISSLSPAAQMPGSRRPRPSSAGWGCGGPGREAGGPARVWVRELGKAAGGWGSRAFAAKPSRFPEFGMNFKGRDGRVSD